MNKKISALILVSAMAMSLSACGSNPHPEDTPTEPPVVEENVEQPSVEELAEETPEAEPEKAEQDNDEKNAEMLKPVLDDLRASGSAMNTVEVFLDMHFQEEFDEMPFVCSEEFAEKYIHKNDIFGAESFNLWNYLPDTEDETKATFRIEWNANEEDMEAVKALFNDPDYTFEGDFIPLKFFLEKQEDGMWIITGADLFR